MKPNRLSDYLTTIDSARLKPINIWQAAELDLRLKLRKEQREAFDDERYSFLNRHVKRARDTDHLIALAYFEPILDRDGYLRTNKDGAHRIYSAREELRLLLGHRLLFRADEEAIRKVQVP